MGSIDATPILVVDDEQDFLDSVCANLEVEGYTVLVASRGDDAIRLVGENAAVGLVLLDIRMPGTNGVDTLSRIREKRPDLPVILMTAYPLDDLEERALELGAYTVLQKPFDMGMALQLIARALRTPTLLVLDPLDGFAARARAILEEAGHRVVAVTTTEDALAAVRSASFDVGMLTIQSVPHLRRTLADLRAAEPGLSVIVVTRHPPMELLAEAPRLGIAGWLPEPATPSSLLRIVAEVRGRGIS